MTTRPKNALSHGLYASDFVAPWENEQDFVELYNSFRDYLDPHGPLQEAEVLNIARLSWTKRRANVATQLAYRRHPDAAAMTEAGQDGWQGIADYVRRSAGDGDRFFDHVRDLAKGHTAALTELIHMAVQQSTSETPSIPAADRERVIRLAEALNKIGTDQILPMMRMIEEYYLDQKVAERAYRPEVIAQQMKLEAEIDRRIDKSFARFYYLESFDNLRATRQVTGRRVDALSAPPSVNDMPATDAGPKRRRREST